MDYFDFPMWVTIVSNFGFPVALAIYLLVRLEIKLEQLTEAIATLRNAIRKK
ncbi:YvrJ family protein [Psychrobacillus sp. MER TA 171]|uniref:YvrJ family protein n=1 Tax=Psychrobacillus sp. MER TA 171 TaxID=2939577 RepID=UPI00203A72CF|nr:YvrJ family protein [Psychrobacillus sp. MER TA 171]MCM3358147.1 YvrJ family protein [Psychrobacillus sp. MER TA 171]